jgi:hypothetical protein
VLARTIGNDAAERFAVAESHCISGGHCGYGNNFVRWLALAYIGVAGYIRLQIQSINNQFIEITPH